MLSTKKISSIAIILFACCASPCVSGAQIKIVNTVLINPDSSDIYVGVENPIEVLNTGTKTYSVAAAKAQIHSGARGHVAKPIVPGPDTIYVVQEGKVIASKIFNASYLPPPSAKLGNISKSVASKEVVIASAALQPCAGNFNDKQLQPIISYVVEIKSNHIREDDAIIPNNSNVLSKRAIAAIKLLKPGDIITFNNIKMQCGDGRTGTLKPLTITIQ